jgi:hypothetical protein
MDKQVMVTLDGDDELRNDWEHFGASLLEHVEHSLHGQESVWVLLLSDSLEENGQVMVIVQLGDLHLPVDLVLRSVLNGDGEVSSIIEPSELTRGNSSLFECSSLRLLGKGLLLWLVETGGLASKTFSLLEDGYEWGNQRECLQIPVAAIDCSCFIVGSRSVTGFFLEAIYSLGKSPKGECWDLGRSLLS